MSDPSSIFLPARRRVGRQRRAAVSSSPTPAALAVVSAVVAGVGGGEAEVHVTFDTTTADPLGDLVAADPLKWTVRVDGTLYQGVLVEPMDYNKIRVPCYETGPDAGADTLFYSNAPSDISDTLGRHLAAFSREL